MLELLLMLLLSPPFNFPASPVVEQSVELPNTLVCLHADQSVSMVSVVPGADQLVCSVADARSLPQGPAPAPLPSLSSSWVSDDNSSHTVSTPIVSTTPAGLDSAIELHRELVRRMKAIYPPKRP